MGATVVALQAASFAFARASGFSHISDDDYARVTIAQTWAHAPRLDPSGTSWLPLPFWWNGAWMMLLGRTLTVAHVVALASSLMATAALFGAARRALTNDVLAAGLALACACSPWAVWTASSTTPEYSTMALVGVALLLTADDAPSSAWIAAACALGACLSRYEAWPAAAVIACALAWRALRSSRGAGEATRFSPYAAAALAAAGPLAWMAWNAHAHGDALHFFARVSRFRALHAGQGGETELPFTTRIAFYPRALLDEAPELACLFAAAIASGVFLMARTRGRTRTRLVPTALATMLAVVAFDVAGSVRDGAPTHHPTRALLVMVPCAAALCAEAWIWGREHARTAAISAALVTAALCVAASARTWTHATPGTSPEESRVAAIALGETLRREDAPRVTLYPCGYEHFATIAAFGFPERVTTLPARGNGAEAKAARKWECPTRMSNVPTNEL